MSDYVDESDKRYVIEFLSDLSLLDSGYPDVHADLLSIFNGHKLELTQDLYHLTLKVESLQMLCRELVREIGERLQIDVRAELEMLNTETAKRARSGIVGLRPAQAKEFVRWLDYNFRNTAGPDG